MEMFYGLGVNPFIWFYRKDTKFWLKCRTIDCRSSIAFDLRVSVYEFLKK